jgi:hypothetical protein
MFTLIKKSIAQKTIKQIHDSFDTAGDNLVKEANLILSNSYRQELILKKEKLRNCGFFNNKLLNEIDILENKLTNAKLIESYSAELNNFYKVITIDDVIEISNKYKLCLSSTSRYAEDVPEKNLKEIENFLSCVKRKGIYGGWDNGSSNLLICAPEKEFLKNTSFYVKNGRLIELKDPIVLYPCEGKLRTSYGSLESKFFYVVTKWGLEASDPLVINNINN